MRCTSVHTRGTTKQFLLLRVGCRVARGILLQYYYILQYTIYHIPYSYYLLFFCTLYTILRILRTVSCTSPAARNRWPFFPPRAEEIPTVLSRAQAQFYTGSLELRPQEEG